MREALAGANHDFLLRDDRRSGAKRPKAKPGKGWRRLLGWRRRSTVAVFLAFAAVAAIGVPLNALYLQDGHHPAPLFRSGSPVATAPLPPQRPAALEAKTPPVKTESAKAEIARPIEKARDPISQLLEAASARKTAPAIKKIAVAKRVAARPRPGPKPIAAKGATIEKLLRDARPPAKAATAPKPQLQLAAKPNAAKR